MRLVEEWLILLSFVFFVFFYYFLNFGCSFLFYLFFTLFLLLPLLLLSSVSISCVNISCLSGFSLINPLSAKFIKWSNTLKQIVGKLPTICLSVFDHFSGLAFKEISHLVIAAFIHYLILFLCYIIFVCYRCYLRENQ